VETVTHPIFLLTDFGAHDQYVGQVKAVIAGIAPGAPIHDLSHEVEPFAVDEGAWMLECALPFLPPGAVVMAVVDPGVGTTRRPIAVVREGRAFVGPDNGLLSACLPDDRRATVSPEGGACLLPPVEVEAREISSHRFRLSNVSHTFHGRDIFAPAAAHLAAGLDHRELGPSIAEIQALPPFRGATASYGSLEGRIIHVDRFGNLITTIREGQIFESAVVEVAGRVVSRRVQAFADAPPGTPCCYADSSGFLAIAINQESAARVLGVGRGEPVRVRPL
jgi:hypothetical protein